MKFCSHCGAELTGERFCPHCGAAAEGNLMGVATVPNYGQINVREHGLLEMEKLLNYFGSKAAKYQECDQLIEEVTKRKKKFYIIWLILGVLLGWFGWWVMLNANINGILGYLVGIGLFILPPILFLALFVWLNIKNRKRIKGAIAQQTALVAELHDHYCNYGNCPIGIEYTWPNVLNILAEIMRQGRTNEIKEAVNIMLDDLHKAKMESLANQTLLEVQRGREAAEMAAHYSQKAARYAEEAADNTRWRVY